MKMKMLKKIINIFNRIINLGAVTDGTNNFYTVDEKLMLALRELLKIEQSEMEKLRKLKNEVHSTPQNL